MKAHLGGELTLCTLEQRILPPRRTAPGAIRLPADLPSGTYRLVHEVEVGGARREVSTSPFDVGPR